jgi:hypothetical protein
VKVKWVDAGGGRGFGDRRVAAESLFAAKYSPGTPNHIGLPLWQWHFQFSPGKIHAELGRLGGPIHPSAKKCPRAFFFEEPVNGFQD